MFDILCGDMLFYIKNLVLLLINFYTKRIKKAEYLKVTIVFFLLLLSGCAGTVTKENLFPPEKKDKIVSVYLTDHGRHTGLVVPVKSISKNIWPEAEDFKSNQFIEVGWGDEDFFKTPDPSLWMTAKAVLLPTSSALHVAGFNKNVKQNFPGIDITKIDLSQKGFNNLCEFISKTYFRDKKNNTHVIRNGLYGNSKFYKAAGKYYFPKMCNFWTARALETAGCPVSPNCTITADNLMSQVNKFGTIVRKKD